MGTSRLVSLDLDDGRLPSALLAALDARYVAAKSNTATQNHQVIVIGDSIDAGGDDDQGTRPYWSGSVWSLTALLSRGRFSLVRNEGIGGQATQQMLDRFRTAVLDRRPGIVIIGGGRNDLNGGVATETTRANIVSMVDQAQSAGIHPVLHTTPPVDVAGGGAFNTVASNRAGTIAHNTWLRSLALQRGIELIDLWRLWADPATGGYLSGYSLDGIHPTGDAVDRAARALALGLLPPVFNATSSLPVGNLDPTNLWANPLLLATNGTAVPDQWYAPTPAPVSITPTALGNRMNLALTGSQLLVYGPGLKVASSVSPGDIVAFSGEVTASGGNVTVTAQILNQDYQAIATPVGGFSRIIEDGVFYQEYKVEASVTNIFLQFAGNGTGSVGLRRPVLRNLTKLGIR
jgi:lysophospholipase L1-like esterase